jgi:TRAP-type mannitol/chloroaromatic compound transport system permease small subunit
MIKGRKGQGAAFVGLIMLLMAFVIFFLAIPFVNDIMSETISNTGTATAWVIRLMPWVALIFLVVFGIKLIIYGGSA